MSSRRFTIHLDRDVAGRLSARCWTALKAMPRHGVDIGGFLLGRMESHDESTEIWIQGFQPADSDQFRQRHRTGGTIGIVRSRKTDQPPSAADADLMAHYSDVADPLLLLVGPLPGSVSIFKQTGGELRCVHTFSLPSFVAPARASHIPRVPKSQSELQGAIEPKPAPKRTRLPLGAAFSAASFALILAAFLAYFGPQIVAAGAAPRNLNLSILGAGPDYKISWDRNAPPLRHATRGVLYICDGDRRNFIDLSSALLKTGSVTYTASTPEPSFRLDVYLAEPDAVGAVQVVKMPLSSPLI